MEEDIELDYGAITIDNASLKGEGYRFYEGILKQMRQFKDSPVQVIQTDIISFVCFIRPLNFILK